MNFLVIDQKIYQEQTYAKFLTLADWLIINIDNTAMN